MIARQAAPHVFGWPIWASVGAHVLGVGVVASVGTLAPAAVPIPASVPVEMVRIEPPSPSPSEPVPPPRKAPVVRATTIPQVITQPQAVASPAAPAPALIRDEPRREPAPAPAPPTDTPARVPAGESSAGGLLSAMPGGARGSRDGLLSTGDLPIGDAPSGAGTGTGESGRGGGANTQTASLGDGNGSGLTAFARPLGGYQTRPRYPDAARREGIEGEAVLRFEVLASGHVGSIAVTRSAGRDDLDRAAVEAVKTWLFAPARRGKEAVTVWVTLPVRFRLGSEVNE